LISLSIHNFGCRVNQAEAFLWADEFQKNGVSLEKDYLQSDFVLVNSCTLTHRSDRDVRQFIKKVSRSNPRARVIVTGCLVDGAYDELREMPHVWRLFPNSEKKDLAEKVLSFIPPQEKAWARVWPFRSRALLKIQDGCSFQCTFCIIPKVRGKSISLPKEEILSQGKKFIDQGFKEIVLTGIHLCSYGHDLNPKSSFLELLQEIERLKGLRKIRLSSLDPRFLNPSLIGHLVSSRKICPHFHLSLQHGSDDILRRMGRNTKVDDFRRIVAHLREHSARAALGADIIVGFPGEREKDFEQTYEFLKQSSLSYFHVFPYSPRPGTPASSWPQVDAKVKKERSSHLRKLSTQKRLNFHRLFVSKELDGIVVKKENGGARILTSNYLDVSVPNCPLAERDEVRVKIKRVSLNGITGEIIPPHLS
jgi:threonylcarbamoyladenosine tRNA methylthiotransferase MtaB